MAVVRAPLSQLLPDDPSGLQAAAAHTHPRPGSTKWHTSRHHKQLPWPLASHVLKASFSDHLHCECVVLVLSGAALLAAAAASIHYVLLLLLLVMFAPCPACW